MTRFRKLLFLHFQKLPMPSRAWRPTFCKWAGVRVECPKNTEIGFDVVFDTMTPENITIEEGVIIANGCKIISHYVDPYKMTPEDRLANRYPLGEVVIKKNAFLGMGTMIVKPVTIGENAVIGAGSIITHNVPSNEVWAGNPARCIGKL